MAIEDPLLNVHGHQLLPLATSQLVNNNIYLMFQGYF